MEGVVALTPIQAWFFATPFEERHHFNQTVWLGTPARVSVRALSRVVQRLVAHHDALRMRYVQEAEGWRQWNAGLEAAQEGCAAVDLSALTGALQAAAVAAVCEQVQRSLALDTGPLLRVVHLGLGAATGGRLLAVVHHLVVDGVSWRILLEDLQQGYAAAVAGAPLTWPAKTTSYRAWAAALRAYAAAGPSAAEQAYWLAAPVPAHEPMPRERTRRQDHASMRRVVVTLRWGDPAAVAGGGTGGAQSGGRIPVGGGVAQPERVERPVGCAGRTGRARARSGDR